MAQAGHGTALEATAEVSLQVEVANGKQADWPRLVDDRFIMSIGSGRPMEDCIRVANFVDPGCTAAVLLPRRYLPEG